MDYRCQMPVLLLFFNRAQHASAVMQRVRQVRPERLYVHCDGPRSGVAGEAEKVEEVRAVLKEIDWNCDVKTLFRDQNMGLRLGVSNALDWFFKQEEMGIILEDDCLPDLTFFPFCEAMLLHYKNEPQVMHIAGSNLAETLTENLIESYFFSKYAFVWGWASWRRAWEKMSLGMEGLDEFTAKNTINTLCNNPMSQEYLIDKFEATQQNRNNSWAYAWLFSVLKNDGLSIVPVKNLVQNTGIGAADATHTNTKDARADIRASHLDFPLIHPNDRKRIPGLDQQLFYLSHKSRGRLFLWYILKKVGLR